MSAIQMVPTPAEYNPAFGRYVSLVSETDVLAALAEQRAAVVSLFGSLSPEKQDFAYAPGKWRVREMLGHLIDSERVFGYRALCIARGETASLPGFEEDDYARNSGAAQVPFAELVEEFDAVRRGHVLMFRHFPPEAWARIGASNGSPASARALASVLVGHPRHHMKILAERYGVPAAS